jgi:hypothetical protein
MREIEDELREMEKELQCSPRKANSRRVGKLGIANRTLAYKAVADAQQSWWCLRPINRIGREPNDAHYATVT